MSRGRFVLVLAIVTMSSQFSFAQGTSTQENAVGRIEVSGGGVVFYSNVPYDWARLTVRKRGEGMVFDERFEAADSLSWGLVSNTGATLTDGRYVYEFIVVRSPVKDADGQTTQLYRPVTIGGTFDIVAGALVSTDNETGGRLPAPADILQNDDVIVEGSLCASDSLACADGESFNNFTGTAEVKAKDNFPGIWLDDTDPNDNSFILEAAVDTFYVRDHDAGTSPFGIEGGAPNNSFYIADTGQIGIGTSNPDPVFSDAMHVVSVKTVIRLENTGSGTTWRIGDLSDGAFSFVIDTNGDGGPTGNVFLISDDNGYVGIRTGTGNLGSLAWTPAAPLHLRKDDAGDLVFQLQTAGNPTNGTYNFAVNTAGVFTVNKSGTGGQEFTVRDRNDALGATLAVQGSVQGTQFISTSSREMKTDFADLDTRAVLDSLVNLPMTSWRYKNSSEDRHFGPMAEDFKEAFELGDGEYISSVDADGVALAAIQGLHQLLQDKDTEIEDLEERIRQLETLVSSLAGSMENE